MVSKILTSLFAKRQKPANPPKTSVTVQQAAKALATIVLCESRHRVYGPDDTMARHFLAMKRYGDTPMMFAMRLVGCSEDELVNAIQAEISDFALSQTIEAGSGWTLDTTRGMNAICSNIKQ